MNSFSKTAKLALFMAVSACGASFAGNWVHVLPAKTAQKTLKEAGTGTEKFTQFGHVVIIQSANAFEKAVNKAEIYKTIELKDDEKLYLITTKDPAVLRAAFPMTRTVFKNFGYIVLAAPETAVMNLKSYQSAFTKVELMPQNRVLLTVPRSGEGMRIKTEDATGKFVSKIDMTAYMKDLNDFVNFKTRYTPVPQAQKALEYGKQLLEKLGYDTRLESFSTYGVKTNNVVAEIKGTDEGKYGQIIVGGHLDSISEDPKNNAPGADDNGTGAAGVIALARLLKASGLKPAATIKFVLFMGEEQGLYGSKAFVKNMSADEISKTKLVLTMDMIGYDKKTPLSMLLETRVAHKAKAEELEKLVKNYTSMTIQISYNPYGSDHMPFLDRNLPAFLAIESEFDDNHNYHKTTDRVDDVNKDLCRNIMALNAAAMYRFGVKPVN